ncbi:MAG: hypothetical protein FJ294_06485 [Planctomycetes bacterium]|nr:hypothetical protein [Planctomycetota bacterium]
MARPLRRLYPMSGVVRRRHRTWMASMCFATAGAAVWGAAMLWRALDPGNGPDLLSTLLASAAFTVPGAILALLSIRARWVWVLLAGIPLFANGVMIVVPWVVLRLRG